VPAASPTASPSAGIGSTAAPPPVPAVFSRAPTAVSVGLTVLPSQPSVGVASPVRIPSTPSGSNRRIGAGIVSPTGALNGTGAASSTKNAKSAPTGPAGWQPRVLIVEDNSINARVLMRALEHMQCRCEWAQNGLEGVTLFAAGRTSPHPYDVVFSDIEMPIMGGLEATMRMRQIEREEGAALRGALTNGISAASAAAGSTAPPLTLPATAAVATPVPERVFASPQLEGQLVAAAAALTTPLADAHLQPSPSRRATPPLQALHALPSPIRTYIACVSGNVRDEFVQAARQAGVDTYIGKPFTREGLAAALHAARTARDMEAQ